ncbi:MAG: hypothetical protein GXP25_25050 [Planctomycetes bacterium]|nr:hypothetical protein [Planctomycetota bacterium]
MAELFIENSSGTVRVVVTLEKGTYRMTARVRVVDDWVDVAQISPKSCWGISVSETVYPVFYSECTRPDADHLCLKASLRMEHDWHVLDEISFESGLIRIQRRWVHDGEGDEAGVHLCLAVRIHPGGDMRIMLPGINYNNNPNADPNRVVPRFSNELPTWGLYEEHRFPIPMVHFEYAKRGSRVRAALISRPGPIKYGMPDQWWTLGAKIGHDHVDLLVTSGLAGTNGEFGAVYGKQNTLETYGDPSLRIPGGVELSKTVYLDLGREQRPGYGFAKAVWSAYDLLQPAAEPRYTSEKVIRLKTQAAKARYREDGGVAGFLCLPEKNVYNARPYFLWGWTGQALRLAWCLCHAGKTTGDNAMTEMAEKSIDFFVQANLPSRSGLTCLRYLVDERRWVGRESPKWGAIASSRQFGEAMNNLADILLLRDCPATWKLLFEKAVRFLAKGKSVAHGGLYPRFWNLDSSIPDRAPTGTAGVFCVSPLAKASRLMGSTEMAHCAMKRLEAYFNYNAKDLKTPYWGGTLDACCEEKEAAIGFMRAVLDVYDATHVDRFLDWARMAAEWILTFVYFWDTGFREGTSCHGKVKTTGWTSVSVQNQHIDVFAPCVEFVRLGELIGEERFVEIAKMMFSAMTQTIATDHDMWGYDAPDKHAVVGEQAEQFFQTNYVQGSSADRSLWRGGMNLWNPSWIIAHVLWQAIEMNKRGY